MYTASSAPRAGSNRGAMVQYLPTEASFHFWTPANGVGGERMTQANR